MAPALREPRGHRQQIGKSAALTVGALTLARAALRRRGTERSSEFGRVNLDRWPHARARGARRLQRARTPRDPPYHPGRRCGCWSTSPFRFSGLVRRFWFGALDDVMMMSAGAGATYGVIDNRSENLQH